MHLDTHVSSKKAVCLEYSRQESQLASALDFFQGEKVSLQQLCCCCKLGGGVRAVVSVALVSLQLQCRRQSFATTTYINSYDGARVVLLGACCLKNHLPAESHHAGCSHSSCLLHDADILLAAAGLARHAGHTGPSCGQTERKSSQWFTSCAQSAPTLAALTPSHNSMQYGGYLTTPQKTARWIPQHT